MSDMTKVSLPVLSIRDLTVAYDTDGVMLNALRDISLDINSGQTLGLVGESGSGKSTLALAIMRYLSTDGKVQRGQILFQARDLLKLDPEEMSAIWGDEIALVPQDAFSSLNPSMRVGEQIGEVLRQHKDFSAAHAHAKTLELLKMVRLADPELVASSYPHQISGGMQQRILIAMALSTQPRLLILDEPTTGLDVTTEAAVLDLFRELIAEQDTSALYVTHNLGVVAGICDRVAVLYASELVEEASTEALYEQPLHPYTQGLLDSVPRMGQRKDVSPLQGIPGQIPPLDDLPPGCVFAPRCSLAIDICHDERPPLDTPLPGRRVRCHRWPEILAGEVSAKEPAPLAKPSKPAEDETIFRLDDLRVTYPLRRTAAEFLSGEPARQVKAVDGVSFAVGKRKTIGIVGESGSGKSSLGRAIIGLVEHATGDMQLLDIQLPRDIDKRSPALLRRLQMVFQNPDEALNPYLTIGETLRRPFMTLMGHSRQTADGLVAELLEAVKLPADYAARRPGQLSGGERQRVAIARAFAAAPDLLIADEPVSALDVSVRASILNLLNEMQMNNDTAVIFISHDIGVVAYLVDQVAVMYLGKLMQVNAAEQIFLPPYHPYSEALLSAVPVPDPTTKQERIRLDGDIPSAVDVPSGCPFHTRCPRFLGDVCVDETPPWQETNDGKRIFCHIPLEELEAEQQRVIVWTNGE